jgi:hypothetical protein
MANGKSVVGDSGEDNVAVRLWLSNVPMLSSPLFTS